MAGSRPIGIRTSRPSGRRARRQFLATYDAARNSFLQEVAQLIGSDVLVLDTNEAGTHVETVTTIKPPPVH